MEKIRVVNLEIKAPKNKKNSWMNIEIRLLNGSKLTKLMAIRGANILLRKAGIKTQLDELTYANE